MPEPVRTDEVPAGCRDPRLWITAAELLVRHSAEAALCPACGAEAPCLVRTSCQEAMARAMDAAAARWVSADDYLSAYVHRHDVSGTPPAAGRCDRRWGRRLFRRGHRS